MNKDGTPIAICPCVCAYTHVRRHMGERARACVSGGDCRFRNNAAEGKGRGNNEEWRGFKEAVARDAGEEETGDVYV